MVVSRTCGRSWEIRIGDWKPVRTPHGQFIMRRLWRDGEELLPEDRERLTGEEAQAKLEELRAADLPVEYRTSDGQWKIHEEK